MRRLSPATPSGFQRALILGAFTLSLAPWTRDAKAANPSPLITGTAGASVVFGTGLEAAFGNPALLGVPASSRVEVRLIGAGASVTNNGFGWGDYRRYNGATLDENDKASILAQIPAGGFEFDAAAGATALAMRIGGWSLRTEAFGYGEGTVDRDAVALLLYGNATRETWEFNEFRGEALAGVKAMLSHGRRVVTLLGGPLYAGVSIAHVRGLFSARSADMAAEFTLGQTGLTGGAQAMLLAAEGGSGWEAGAGLAWRPNGTWTIGISGEHLISYINWNINPEIRRYDLVFNDLTADNFDDSLWVAEERREAAGAYSRGVPAMLHAGAGLTVSRWRAAASLSVSPEDRLGFSTSPQLACGAEFAALPFLPLRAGVAAGGLAGFTAGWGAGLHLGFVHIDAGIQVDRGLWIGSGRGLTGALALDLAF